MIAADLEQQAEQARAVRRQLAAERCECGTCAPVFVVECHECGTMETPCRMYANRHREPLRCEPCFFKVKP